MLAIYGHPFSSYTWKVLIALYANDTPFEFRLVGPDQPAHNAFVAANSGPLGKFPVLEDSGAVVFESSAIIEYLAYHYPGAEPLLPEPPEAAIGARMLDRLFDNYVMTPMQAIVAEHLHPEAARGHSRITTAREHLDKSYRWLEEWLEWYRILPEITLIECAAAPALYYADWVHPIGEACPRLHAWLAQLKGLPPVRRCIEDARPWREFFPVPMPAPAD